VLAEELTEIGLRGVRADRGGVRFEGPIEDGFRACLHSRIALRILYPIARFPAPDPDALYGGVHTIPWENWISRRHTLAVRAVSKNSALRHTAYIAQKTKDAIVDRIRAREGDRPDVDKRDPDVVVFLHLADDAATVQLDLSGGSLHRRGWRRTIGRAPLKETLAAAVLRLAGWDRHRPLVDPMCGSGTLPIEADLWARSVAPGLMRERFGIERWVSHDDAERRRFRELREEARSAERAKGPVVLGSDRDPHAIAAARANARRAGSRARFRHASMHELGPTDPPAHVVANVPYGRRCDEGAIWSELAEVLPRLRGVRLSLLLHAPPPPRVLPRPSTIHRLWNGPIECRLMSWDLG
jgi:putative N6-adenine-specific DNA methylase